MATITFPGHTRRVQRFFSKYGMGYLFIAPALILFVMFMVYPFISSFYLSLTAWNGADAVKVFIGLENYVNLSRDKVFWISLSHNLFWMVFGTIVPISLGLGLAMLIWNRPKGFLLYRTVFFLPQILGEGILAVIWKMIYQPRRGVLYVIGKQFDIGWMTFSPLAGTNTAQWALFAAAVWASAGFYFVILLAGLQNVEKDLLDSAKVDGANGFQRFIHVVLPQISHVMTLVTVLALIGGIKIFGIVSAITNGGPGTSTEVIATYAYKQFSQLSNVGYSASLTMIMAMLALVVTVAFIRLRERRA
jgi:ABC-type sugar transport system permease subunit